uniref:Uncharacterized protein n=1 Tax=Cacopsylla melanoneura TaxID=428564 RepID=A0A8D8RLZ0_9HEMI
MLPSSYFLFILSALVFILHPQNTKYLNFSPLHTPILLSTHTHFLFIMFATRPQHISPPLFSPFFIAYWKNFTGFWGIFGRAKDFTTRSSFPSSLIFFFYFRFLRFNVLYYSIFFQRPVCREFLGKCMALILSFNKYHRK